LIPKIKIHPPSFFSWNLEDMKKINVITATQAENLQSYLLVDQILSFCTKSDNTLHFEPNPIVLHQIAYNHQA